MRCSRAVAAVAVPSPNGAFRLQARGHLRAPSRTRTRTGPQQRAFRSAAQPGSAAHRGRDRGSACQEDMARNPFVRCPLSSMD